MEHQRWHWNWTKTMTGALEVHWKTITMMISIGIIRYNISIPWTKGTECKCGRPNKSEHQITCLNHHLYQKKVLLNFKPPISPSGTPFPKLPPPPGTICWAVVWIWDNDFELLWLQQCFLVKHLLTVGAWKPSWLMWFDIFWHMFFVLMNQTSYSRTKDSLLDMSKQNWVVCEAMAKHWLLVHTVVNISVSPQEKIAFFIVFPGERSAIETPPGFLRHLYIAIVKSHKMLETTWPQNKTSLNIL